MKWLMAQKLEHREQRITFEELLDGIRQEKRSASSVWKKAIREAVPESGRSPRFCRGPSGDAGGLISLRRVGVLAEIGDSLPLSKSARA